MFKKLRIKNFRSVADSKDLNLSRLNILVGPNNSGKSSILYTMLLLKQTLQDEARESVLVTTGPHVDLGSYLDIVRDHKTEDSIEIEFDLDEEYMPKIIVPKFREATEVSVQPFSKYKLEFGFELPKNEINIRSFALSSSKPKTIFAGKLGDSGWVIDGIDEELQEHVKINFNHFLPFLSPKGRRPKDNNILMAASEQLILSHMKLAFLSHFFEHMLYVGPIREHIPRYSILGTIPYSELGPSGQNLIRVLSQATRRGRSKKTILQELNYWLDKKFKLLKKVSITDIDRGKTVKALVAEDVRGDVTINLAATGSGISQLVPVVVQTVLTPKGGCLLIEQPEIHLHPAAQADLADLFVNHAQQGKQLVVETHSEHLLLRVRRRVAEGRISPDLVHVFLVEKTKGVTKVRCLKLEKNGHFKRWPRGFFEEGYKEAIAIAEAQSK